MRADWVNLFTQSLYHAALRDLYTDGHVEWLEVLTAYTETFGDTTMGRGGFGGQAITSTLTVAVRDIVSTGAVAIYRGGRLDYIVKNPSQEALTRIVSRDIPPYTKRHELMVAKPAYHGGSDPPAPDGGG